MKFIIPIIGYFLSAGFVRAEISFFEFLSQNQNEFIQFKILDQSLALKGIERKLFLSTFSNAVSLEIRKEQTRPLPSAKDFESSQDSIYQGISYKKELLNSGTNFKIYSRFVNNKIIGKKPVFSQVPTSYSVSHGIILEQSLGRNNFGETNRAILKKLEYEQKITKLDIENYKLDLIKSIAAQYANLIHLANLEKLFLEKCSKAKVSYKLARKKRKRALISPLELGLVKHGHSTCRAQLKTIRLHQSTVKKHIQSNFLTPVDLSKVKSFKIKLQYSAIDLGPKLKLRRENEKSINKYHIKQAKSNLLPDVKLELAYHSYGEGHSNSLRHKDQSSELTLGLKYTIPFGDIHQKQELSAARIQKIKSNLERLRREKSIRTNLKIFEDQNKDIKLRMVKDNERLNELKHLNLSAQNQFAKGKINYDQLNEVANAYYEIQINIEDKKRNLFLNNINKLLITQRLTGVIK
jgi:outer membrane protein TolC